MNFISLPVFLLLCFATLSCATSPMGRRQLHLIPSQEMNQLGRRSFQELKQVEKKSTNKTQIAYVNCIVNQLLPTVGGGNWETVLFENEAPNAFALPGGFIGVYTGMLKVAENQDQLAAVIGHEIGHVIAEHSNERVSQNFAVQNALVLGQVLVGQESPSKNLLLAALGIGAQVGILLPYSRTHETEADIIGQNLMAKAGFSPTASVDLWKNMQKMGGGQPPQFLSTHPSHRTRIQGLEANLKESEKFFEAAKRKPNCVLK